MAGDWIKMRTDLRTHPKVVRISSALDADTLRTVGGLWSVWSLFDLHSTDGKLVGYTTEVVDSLIGWPGFAAAMERVGWLESCVIDDAPSLVAPRFDAHNGQSAKRRAQEAERKRLVRKASASDADKNGIREEKRREESINTPLPPRGRENGEAEMSNDEGSGDEFQLGGLEPAVSAKKKKGGAGEGELSWSAETGWVGFTADLMGELDAAYPACNIRRQFLAMEQWLKANPGRAVKSNWRRFVNNWLRREQDRGGDLRGQPGAKKETGGAGSSDDAFSASLGGRR